MLISTLGASIAYLIFGLAHTLSLLFISRLIAGIMGGNISTAQAYVADVTPPEERARGMGLIGAAFGIGFVLGPAAATFLVHPKILEFFRIPVEHHYALPGFFASVLSLASFLMVFFRLPETVNVSERELDRSFKLKTGVFRREFWQTIFFHRTDRPPSLFPLLILCVFLLSFAHSSLYSAFPLFCKFRMNLSAEKVGMQFVLMGVIAVIIQGGLIRKLVKIASEEKLFLTGNALMLLGFLALPLTRSLPLLSAVLSLVAIGASLNGPTLNSLVSQEADPTKLGSTMGTSQGISGLGRVLGPAIGGFLYDRAYFAPFWIVAATLCVPFYIGLKLSKLRQKTS